MLLWQQNHGSSRGDVYRCGLGEHSDGSAAKTPFKKELLGTNKVKRCRWCGGQIYVQHSTDWYCKLRQELVPTKTQNTVISRSFAIQQNVQNACAYSQTPAIRVSTTATPQVPENESEKKIVKYGTSCVPYWFKPW